jgi:drug/metabolite transporter (DMT)-like permease
MKPVAIVGVVLIVLGAVILFTGGLGFGSRSVMSVGDLHMSAEQHRAVPPWVGGVAIVGGLLVIGVGMRKTSAG